ncbi:MULTISPECIES: cache domain-containing protein [Rhodobacterales]|uniref:sensor histidine kinase n=1 Tax=Rhodobacterales TaxID=204455 RepID=UPI00201F89A7|nr:cache domain-containing protein [Marivivens sp.]MCL7407380.1 cache domain-containing protein [Marivivens geojensis]
MPTVIRSVRVRLLVIALLPMLVLLPFLLSATMIRWSGKVDGLLISKVTGDLTIADQYLGRLLETQGERVNAVAQSAALQQVIDNEADRNWWLERERQRLGLDFLYLTIGEDGPNGFNARHWPVINEAFRGNGHSAVDIISGADLDRLSTGLAEKASVPLVETVAAVPTERTVEDRGMILHSASPIRFDNKNGALVGGVLLNKNLDFIDTINALVYREQSLPEGSKGTATLFLDDVRISTNVRLFENVRALGTRVSAIVRNRVLEDGNLWLDRAFVVNDWYISGYEPIVDSFGNRVGMLYVGFLETPFRTAKIVSALTISILFLLIALISVPIFLRWAGRIFLPLERMTQTIERVEAGDLTARNRLDDQTGEIAQVAGHLDHLLDQLSERDKELREWGESLEVKVEERTRDLSDANQKLAQTTERLIMSEKLAAVGEITAGIAHEINNPIAVIQGNLEVARSQLGETAKEVKTEFDLIDDQVYRIGSIVSKLLQFARPNEYSGAANHITPSSVVRDCLVLTRHQIDAAGITTTTDITSDAEVVMARTELQQVVVNLILNAIHAMPQGGSLSLSVYDQDSSVMIKVHDSGAGIPSDIVARIFDPFFTTKQAQGTGLGLSISQTLVTRAGGQITVKSEVGVGSIFEIRLPAL